MTKHNTKTPTMISAIKHPNRFGSLPAVQWLESWAGWVLWLKAVFALPMDESELAIYRQMHWPGDPPTVAPPEVYNHRWPSWRQVLHISLNGRLSAVSALTSIP
jgi:hypothetical protein